SFLAEVVHEVSQSLAAQDSSLAGYPVCAHRDRNAVHTCNAGRRHGSARAADPDVRHDLHWRLLIPAALPFETPACAAPRSCHRITDADEEIGMINPYFLMTFLYVVLAVLAALDASLINLDLLPTFAGLRWMRVHFITLGALTEFAFGILPLLVAARNG